MTMKIINCFARTVIAGAAVWISDGVAIQAMAEGAPIIAKVIAVKGPARFSLDSRSWQPLKPGDLLNPGSLIQTGGKASVDIQLGDAEIASGAANEVRILENSVLSIIKLSAQGAGADRVEDIELSLRTGQVTGLAPRITAASNFEITIPGGVVGIRGGNYQINSAGIVSVRTGVAVVALTTANGSVTTKEVIAGHRFDSATGLITELPPNAPQENAPSKTNSEAKPAPAAPLNPATGYRPPLRKF
jgi:hypothetical protein